MPNKTCALALLLLFRIIGSIGAQRIVSTFEPLKSAERLAYMGGDRKHALNLYAQDIRSLRTTRLLGSWDGVTEWGEVQFTEDRKECFFLRETGARGVESLCRLDGNAGTIVSLLWNISPIFRISSDGQFLLFNSINGYARFNSRGGRSGLSTEWGVFFLVSADDGKLLDVFDWKVKRDSGGGFIIYRDTAGLFKVYYTVEGSFILAAGTVNPYTKAFQILWDETDNDTFSPVPKHTDEAYQDDVVKQPYDPTLRLKDN
ncbi:hypothetical protein [Treponema endosymbiont of Eucomonympha sp.]|uniref:hypothetical protein n=1 Tax=Treponema endosymbiont of Eucomonympha sp. TaxID=1580831 RepID=UPI0007512A0B|nr:hypothetical protein [Treponema endosymbiont of Eucomonympha sp.]